MADKIEWMKARAIATQTFRKSRKEEWQDYVSKLNVNTRFNCLGNDQEN